MSDNGPNALIKSIYSETIRKVMGWFGNVVKVTVQMFNHAWLLTWQEACTALPQAVRKASEKCGWWYDPDRCENIITCTNTSYVS